MEPEDAELLVRDTRNLSLGARVDWGWRVTPLLHADRLNLFIHLFAVPAFIAGHLLPLVGVVDLVVGGALVLLSLAMQFYGHRREAVPSPPFRGAGDFLRRLYIEQWLNFWRFLLGGGWLRALHGRGQSRR